MLHKRKTGSLIVQRICYLISQINIHTYCNKPILISRHISQRPEHFFHFLFRNSVLYILLNHHLQKTVTVFYKKLFPAIILRFMLHPFHAHLIRALHCFL